MSEQNPEDIQNEFLKEHGVNIEDWERKGYEFRFFICPSVNERVKYFNSLTAQHGNGNVAEVPLHRGGRSISPSEPVSGWAFFVKKAATPKP